MNALNSAALSPKGDLLACCGFELEENSVLNFGSVKEVDAHTRVVEANANPIAMALAYLGPVFLKEVVEQVKPDIRFPVRYASMCEVCQTVVHNPKAVAALRHSENLYVPATNTVRTMSQRLAG
ncbi:hypothetical protein JCM17960_18280 [Magnetospira thiophila]